MVKLTSLLAFTGCLFASQSLAAAVPKPSNSTGLVEECNSFKLTFPTASNLKWSDNTCYKIKYEVQKSRPDDSMIYVSLMRSNGEYVSTLVNGEKTSKTGKSVPFNLYLGAHPVDGDYYLSVKFSNGHECAPKNSPIIHVTHKANAKYPKCR